MRTFSRILIASASVGALSLSGSPAQAAAVCDGKAVTVDLNQPGAPNPDRPASDVILGTSGNDDISAGSGDDTICGGLGDDVMDAGPGTDTISYREAPSEIDVDLSYPFDQDTGGAGTDQPIGAERLIGSKFDDNLDGAKVLVDGLGGLDFVRGADESDVVVRGGSGDDQVFGGNGDDTLDGGPGDDTVDGGDGNDSLKGGDGADLASYATSSDPVNVKLVTTAQNTGTKGTDTIASDVEGLEGGYANDKLTGNAASNHLIGGGGDDTLKGGAGNDVLEGSDFYNPSLPQFIGNDTTYGESGNDIIHSNHGNDTASGGDGTDTITFEHSYPGGVTANLATGQASGMGTDTLATFENLTGSTYDDALTGNDGNNTLNGGEGTDSVDGGNGNDTVSYATLDDAVSVDLAISGPQDTWGGGTDTLANIEKVTGTTEDDELSGNDGNNVLKGGAGGDRLNGRGGNDKLQGQDGADTADYSQATNTVKLDLALTTAQATGAAGTDTVSAVENVIGGSGNDNLKGTTLNNVLNGGSGNDKLNGRAGVDTADYAKSEGVDEEDNLAIDLNLTAAQDTGGAGTDTLLGLENVIAGDGEDTLFGTDAKNVLNGGYGPDTYDGRGGSDTVDYSFLTFAQSANVDLGVPLEQNTGGGGLETLTSIENLIGGRGHDTLIGTSGNNKLYGGPGSDALDGKEGTDKCDGGLDGETDTAANCETLTNIP